ncbi:MAG: VanW family protein [Candidatus Atribacteria bacterium]|nr:VanW family protein [Candidatus Atribacteria bacterium]MBE3091537.1 VanW family protein [Candidatus Atribacteria bacterium]MBE3092905.1 VanW family protein [Chloroflexota bacterium]MBE3127012.1 VanW family protein [Candidatus Atribacteria bacterium]
MKYYPKKKKNGEVRKILLSLIIIIVAVSLVDAVDLYKNRNKILPGISAFSVELERLKKEEAREILQPIASKMIDSPRILVFEDQEIKITPHTELGAFIDLNRVVDEAYSFARTGNIFKRIKNRIVVWRKGYEVPFQAEFDPQKFEDFQNKISSLINRMPCDAYIEGNRIIESRIGVKLDLEKFKEEINESLKSLDEEKYIVNLPVITIDPKITTQNILKELAINGELGTYPTSLENKEENTIYNIKLASEVINGILVKPEEIFSFNKYVGPAEKADGYKESTIIANGVFANGYGGGICQVSSTLYNAALLANLPIIERYNHSVYGEATKYVPLGQDAAIFYEFKDLRFKNNSDHMIVIFSKVFRDTLQVSIFGGNKGKAEVEIISKDKKVIDYQIIREKDSKLEAGQEKVVQGGVPGYQIKTYRIVRKDGEEKIEFLAEDTYNSVPMIIREK